MHTQDATARTNQNVCDNVDAEAVFNETLKVLGDFWVLRVLCALEEKPQRFCELERTLRNSNPVTLTKKLKKLEETGYIVRQTESLDKQAVNYGLTEKGYDTLPIVSAIRHFSQKNT